MTKRRVPYISNTCRCCYVPILITTFPQWNVSMAAVRGAVRPSMLLTAVTHNLVIYCVTHHCTDQRDINLICLVTSLFTFMTLHGVMSSSRIKNLRNTFTNKRLYYSQSSWRDFLSYNGGKVEISGGYICIFVVSSVLESK